MWRVQRFGEPHRSVLAKRRKIGHLGVLLYMLPPVLRSCYLSDCQAILFQREPVLWNSPSGVFVHSDMAPPPPFAQHELPPYPGDILKWSIYSVEVIFAVSHYSRARWRVGHSRRSL